MSHGATLLEILRCAETGHKLGEWYGINQGPFDTAPRQQMRSCECGRRWEEKDSDWLINLRANCKHEFTDHSIVCFKCGAHKV